MYLRTTTSRRRKDGSVVRYLQLAHNDWDAAAGRAKAKVLYNFGREDRLDRAAVARLVASLRMSTSFGPTVLASFGPTCAAASAAPHPR
jgi:hypothetical protein